MQKTAREGQKLINSQHFDSATIKYKIGKLDEMYCNFSQQLEQHKCTIDQTVKFLRSSVPVSFTFSRHAIIRLELKNIEAYRYKF